MPLTKEAIESFQAAYKKDHNEEINFEEARFMAGEILECLRELWAFYRSHENDAPPAPRFGPDLSPSCVLDDHPRNGG